MNQLSTTRAFFFLIWLSFQRQARAHLMVWISLGLLGLSLLIVGINTSAGRMSMAHWRMPRGKGLNQKERLQVFNAAASRVQPPGINVGPQIVLDGLDAAIVHGSGIFVFTDWVVFRLFATFLLPLWSIAFATEGLGREREANNLLWVLTRPIPRSAIFIAKYLALLPWCLLMNLGGFGLLCLAGGYHGRLAWTIYWPAVFWATLAFSALFHLMGACLRRSAIIALLYAFFLETVMGNMPGHFKRLSISFYTRCMMYDRVQEFGIGISPDQPNIFMSVSGTTACLVLAGVTVVGLIVGAMVFSRNEYLDVN